jgi:hypothetical protein
MQNEKLEELLKNAIRLEQDFDVEVYVTPKTRRAKIINALYVFCAFILLGLMVALPLWWGRLACALAFIVSAFAFDRESRLRWR